MSRPAALPLALLAAAAFAVACGGRLERDSRSGADAVAVDDDASAAPDEAFASEAERTRAMEERAAELEQDLQAAMTDAATDEERQRAYEEFEQGRLELQEMSESEGADDEGDAYGEPPRR